MSGLAPEADVQGNHRPPEPRLMPWFNVCKLATTPCVITSDCKGAVLGFRAVQNAQSLPKHLAKGPCADLWQAFLVALKGAPCMAVRWMPAHCTKEELCARGGSEEDWTGNDEADKRAKQEARKFAPPDWLGQDLSLIHIRRGRRRLRRQIRGRTLE